MTWAEPRAGGASVDPNTWVAIARVGRPHGVRGGVHVHLENPESELLHEGLTVRLVLPGGKSEQRLVSDVYGPGLVRFEGIGDRDVAASWRGAEVLVQRGDFPELEPDETYLVDLVGARVQHKDGRELGIIEGFDAGAVQPLAQVRRTFEGSPGDVVDVPFVPGLVIDVDEEKRVVTVDPPWGLLEGEPEEAAAVPPSPRRGRR